MDFDASFSRGGTIPTPIPHHTHTHTDTRTHTHGHTDTHTHTHTQTHRHTDTQTHRHTDTHTHRHTDTHTHRHTHTSRVQHTPCRPLSPRRPLCSRPGRREVRAQTQPLRTTPCCQRRPPHLHAARAGQAPAVWHSPWRTKPGTAVEHNRSRGVRRHASAGGNKSSRVEVCGDSFPPNLCVFTLSHTHSLPSPLSPSRLTTHKTAPHSRPQRCLSPHQMR